jgi:hypothetical protein
MRHLIKGVTLVGAALRVTGVTVAALAMLAAAPQGALAQSVVTAGDAGSAAIVGTGPGSPETPAQLPGSANRPVLSRGGGSGATGGATKQGTKAKSNTGTKSASKAGSNTGTRSASKAKSNTGTRSASKAASNTGTHSVSKATTAGTKHATGTATVTSEGAATSVVTPSNVASANANGANASGANANAANVNANAENANAQPNAVAGFQQAPANGSTQAQDPGQPGQQLGAQAGPQPGQQLGAQAGPQAGQQPGAQAVPPMTTQVAGQGPVGLQSLPSTSTAGAALPAGTIALLSMGGALYAIRRKTRR